MTSTQAAVSLVAAWNDFAAFLERSPTLADVLKLPPAVALRTACKNAAGALSKAGPEGQLPAKAPPVP